MSRLCDMSEDERRDFLNFLSSITAINLPDGVNFVIVVLDEKHENLHYVGNGQASNPDDMLMSANMLRHAAIRAEGDLPEPGLTLAPSSN